MKLNLEKCIKDGVEQAMSDYELTIGMTVKEAVEKQIPKKPKIRKVGFRSLYYYCPCPHCDQCLVSEIDGNLVAGRKYRYCFGCGQKLKWESDNNG